MFSSFLKTNFTFSPTKLVSLLLCLSLVINIPFGFEFSAYEFDWYSDTSNGQLKTYPVYILKASEIVNTRIGQIVEFGEYVIRDGITLAFLITLNLICFIQMRKHSIKKQSLFLQSSRPPSNVIASSSTSNQIMDLKKKKEQIKQRSITYMTITLVLISTLVRLTPLSSGIYWMFAYDNVAVVLGVLADCAAALNSIYPFFVYCKFNKKYRKIFLKLLSCRKISASVNTVQVI